MGPPLGQRTVTLPSFVASRLGPRGAKNSSDNCHDEINFRLNTKHSCWCMLALGTRRESFTILPSMSGALPLAVGLQPFRAD